jgi:hypothetical protein
LAVQTVSNLPPKYLLRLAACLAVALANGCANPSPKTTRSQQSAAVLQRQILQLDRSVDEGEATRLAHAAVEGSNALARQYRAVWPASFHNMLVNAGLRERGLCFHWANDLLQRLHQHQLTSVELHPVSARQGTRHEHNAIVVTAIGQPFTKGIVLDPWRDAGRLWFGKAAADKYPWQPVPDGWRQRN